MVFTNRTEKLPQVILAFAIDVFLLLLVLYFGMLIASVLPLPPQYGELQDRLPGLAAQINSIGRIAWDFLEPILQILAILAILDWLFSKIGFSLTRNRIQLELNTQNIIAFTVIGGFTIAALMGDESAARLLKDLALVVIGFYFGTRNKDDKAGRAPKEAYTEISQEEIAEQVETGFSSPRVYPPSSREDNS
ncbi:MAG: hypothetical protein AAGH67_03195 [Cyanobacteria bacterium P01_H01_bin.162]